MKLIFKTTAICLFALLLASYSHGQNAQNSATTPGSGGPSGNHITIIGKVITWAMCGPGDEVCAKFPSKENIVIVIQDMVTLPVGTTHSAADGRLHMTVQDDPRHGKHARIRYSGSPK